MKGEKLAELLERKIAEKPWDDYILLDKRLVRMVVEALRRAASASS